MPILTEDIKLLKSAVMADTPEGGGAMTGIAVIDGQSNNLFPDTSAMDRAFGRINMRKVFGVAHTDNTDTLMGAHAIVTGAPADPLVHCTLLKTAGWADTRNTAKDGVEKYLVKGPRLSFRLWDTHYAGSLQVRLVSLVGGTSPAGGDALVLRNPNGQEQYVRVLRVALTTQTVAVIEGGGTVLLSASVATCDIGNSLAFDFFGPPATRAGLDESQWAQLFSTNVAGGARFYGIKPLSTPGAPGDYSVLTKGGLYTPVVPAATVESPLIDLYPLISRQSLSRTASRSITLPAISLTLAPGTVLNLPTEAEPGSVSINHGGTLFGDNGAGILKQGLNEVGLISYVGRSITMNPGSPNYGKLSNTVNYRPATAAGAATHSDWLPITLANQGLVFTAAFEPPPAPGTFTLSYMAQGKWYDLQDNANGKLSGIEPSYGVGTINYGTGSVGITLGAIPDVGSVLMYQWGNAAVAVPFSGVAPEKLSMKISLPASNYGGTVQLTWVSGGNSYSSISDASGNLIGDATGTVQMVSRPNSTFVRGTTYQNSFWDFSTEIDFAPNMLPTGDISVTRNVGNFNDSLWSLNTLGQFTLPNWPVAPGSVSGAVYPIAQNGFDIPGLLYFKDNSAGQLVGVNAGMEGLVLGSVNYNTGGIVMLTSVAANIYENVVQSYPSAQNNTLFYEKKVMRNAHTVAISFAQHQSFAYRKVGAGASTPTTVPAGPWSMTLPVPTGLKLRTTGLVFSLNTEVYYTSAGVLSRGWNGITAAPIESSAGSITDAGVISFTSPLGTGSNSVTLVNAAVDVARGLSVGQGVFRIASAPIKVGVFQIQAGAQVGSANSSGVISGGGWGGSVDFQRGVVSWVHNKGAGAPDISASELSYNAVFLQYLPLDATLLGLDTVRLPLDGKVSIYRPGDLLVVHNTLTTQLPNPLIKGTAYSLGRERIASVRVKDVLGVLVPSSLYVSALNPGTLAFNVGADITPYSQPFTVENRIEDMLVCSVADISGQLKTTSSLTHTFPANTSFVSSALPFGDLFARPYNYIEQAAWSGVWSDTLIGSAPLSNYNEGQYPIFCTNRGAITERWALIFVNSTSVRVVGESVGDLGIFSIVAAIAPINPATGAAYLSIPPLGWGNGWPVGAVLRVNTAACGAPFWPIRTVLQGPATLDSDVFSFAFRADVDRP
jgi:hypothetical protein